MVSRSMPRYPTTSPSQASDIRGDSMRSKCRTKRLIFEKFLLTVALLHSWLSASWRLPPALVQAYHNGAWPQSAGQASRNHLPGVDMCGWVHHPASTHPLCPILGTPRPRSLIIHCLTTHSTIQNTGQLYVTPSTQYPPDEEQ